MEISIISSNPENNRNYNAQIALIGLIMINSDKMMMIIILFSSSIEKGVIIINFYLHYDS